MLRRKTLVGPLQAIARSLLESDRPRHLQAGGDRPILLLPGFAASSRVLLPLERHLRRALGRPVVRVPLGGRLAIQLADIRASAQRANDELARLAADPRFEYADVVGHSMGGLVATYLLKRLDLGRRVRRVVTLGTPHRGTPLALAGIVALGAFSRAIWQMIPGAPLLRELAMLPVPFGSELIALRSDGDALVPASFAAVSEAPRHRNAGLAQLGHIELLTAPSALRAVSATLGA